MGPAEDLRVITLVERGLQEVDALNGEPDVQAVLYRTLGGVYQQLGRLAMAEDLLERSLALRRRLFGEDDPQTTDSLMALSLLRIEQARMEEGERLAREALAITERRLPSGHPQSARARAVLGRVLEYRGKYAEAIPFLEEAARLQQVSGAAAVEQAETLTYLANTQFYSGNYDVAGELNWRVLEMNREIYGERHPRVADNLINLGAIAMEQGRHGESESFFRKGQAIKEACYGPDHTQTASAVTMLGRVLIQ